MSSILRGGTARSGHDVPFLVEQWRALAEARDWSCTVLIEADGFPVLAIENEASQARKGGGLYVSAGVHGDECAPPWALLEWAEAIEENGETPLLLLPCLNPGGVRDNTRTTPGGVDLNRGFQDGSIPLVGAWHSFLDGRCFDRAINLHEDYDATGIYLYELARSASIGHDLLAACEEGIPREAADEVDGSEFENGLLRRDVDEESLRQVVEEDLEGGWPEAIWLYLEHAKDSFTFETPSEMELARRIAAHRDFLVAAASPLLRVGE